MSVLNHPYFRDEEAAHSFLESILWMNGTTCSHCGVIGTAYKIAANPEKHVRYGLWKCRDCRKQFTCRVGTVFEHVRMPLHKALHAAYLLCASKKGVSAHQISRMLDQPEGRLVHRSSGSRSHDTSYGRTDGWRRQNGRGR